MRSTADAARSLGLSFRQLDHLARTGVIDLTDGSNTPGSGRRRGWDDATVDQLRVAVALNDVVACPGVSALPSLAAAVMRAEAPPREGWVLYTRASSTVSYARDIADLAEAIATMPGVVVARFALDP